MTFLAPSGPSSWTLSHKLRMISQFSLVRFSSVALSVNYAFPNSPTQVTEQNAFHSPSRPSSCNPECMGVQGRMKIRIRDIRGHNQHDIQTAKQERLTNDIIIRIRRPSSKHPCFLSSFPVYSSGKRFRSFFLHRYNQKIKLAPTR
jgi:hypothetical protein